MAADELAVAATAKKALFSLAQLPSPFAGTGAALSRRRGAPGPREDPTAAGVSTTTSAAVPKTFRNRKPRRRDLT